jgi:integrase
LVIRPSDEDEDGPERTVKTEESERTVPLHSRVIELGFLDYLDGLKGSQMFPEIVPDTRGRWSGHWSKWFGRYRRANGLDKRWVDFHSFRHSWKQVARDARIDEQHHDAISGHEDGKVGRTYGGISMVTLKEDLDKISFDVSIPKWKAP